MKNNSDDHYLASAHFNSKINNNTSFLFFN